MAGATLDLKRRRGGRVYTPRAELNVTPLVDVMLVLLIVFMVTAPLLSVGVPVNLPQTAASQLTDQKEPLVVTVNSEGKIFLQETPVELEALGARLSAVVANKADQVIYVRGDKAIDYGRVMSVMGALVSAGFSKVSLVAEMPRQGTPAAKPPSSRRR